jgi:Peptidase M15
MTCPRLTRQSACSALALCGLALSGLALSGMTAGASAQDSTDWANEFFAKSSASSEAAASQRSPVRAVRRRAFTEHPTTLPTEARESTSLAGNAITWHASAGCVPSQLREVLADVVSNFGPITVTSTCRSVTANRAAGGAGQSYHLSGKAVDFRVSGGAGAVYASLSANSAVGGLKHYGGGLFHIDTGPRRPF